MERIPLVNFFIELKSSHYHFLYSRLAFSFIWYFFQNLFLMNFPCLQSQLLTTQKKQLGLRDDEDASNHFHQIFFF